MDNTEVNWPDPVPPLSEAEQKEQLSMFADFQNHHLNLDSEPWEPLMEKPAWFGVNRCEACRFHSENIRGYGGNFPGSTNPFHSYWVGVCRMCGTGCISGDFFKPQPIEEGLLMYVYVANRQIFYHLFAGYLHAFQTTITDTVMQLKVAGQFSKTINLFSKVDNELEKAAPIDQKK